MLRFSVNSIVFLAFLYVRSAKSVRKGIHRESLLFNTNDCFCRHLFRSDSLSLPASGLECSPLPYVHVVCRVLFALLPTPGTTSVSALSPLAVCANPRVDGQPLDRVVEYTTAAKETNVARLYGKQ